MKELTEFLSKGGTFFRDIFNYLLPAMPLAICLALTIPDITKIDYDQCTKRLVLFNFDFVREATMLTLIYFLGRLMNAVSYPYFFLLKLASGVFRRTPSPPTDNSSPIRRPSPRFPNAANYNASELALFALQLGSTSGQATISPADRENFMYTAINSRKPELIKTDLERLNLVSMFEQSISTTFLTILVLVSLDNTIELTLKLILVSVSLVISLIFYSNWLISYADLNYTLIAAFGEATRSDNSSHISGSPA